MLTKGTRVQLHPATDAWMQGDRFGEVVGYGHKREYVAIDGQHHEARPVRIKMDISGRVLRSHEDDLTVV